MIEVSTETKALVERQAKFVCVTAKVKLESFNQELNAYAIARSLKEIGVNWPDALAPKVLEVLKKGGNASALRQAITEDKKKQDTATTQVVAELLKM